MEEETHPRPQAAEERMGDPVRHPRRGTEWVGPVALVEEDREEIRGLEHQEGQEVQEDQENQVGQEGTLGVVHQAGCRRGLVAC